MGQCPRSDARVQSFYDWVLRARLKILFTQILTFAALWFASAPNVRVRVRRSGRSGGSEQPRGEVRQVVASVALCSIRRMLRTQTFGYTTIVHLSYINEDTNQDNRML